VAGNRGDDDNITAALARHRGQRGRGDVQQAAHGGLGLAQARLGRSPIGSAASRRVVAVGDDEDVEAAPCFDDVADQDARPRPRAEVGGEREHLAACLSDLRGQGVEAVGCDGRRRERDMRPFGCEQARSRLPDQGGRSRDQRDLARSLPCHRDPPLLGCGFASDAPGCNS